VELVYQLALTMVVLAAAVETPLLVVLELQIKVMAVEVLQAIHQAMAVVVQVAWELIALAAQMLQVEQVVQV
jgi:hypothetical protein